MASYVKFELEDGTIVYVESTDVPKGASGFPLGTKGEHPSEQAAVSFEKAIESVRKMASSLIKEMREGFVQAPDEVQVNFGLKASGEIGSLIVARGGMEANYNVMLRWGSEEAAEKAKAAKEEKAAEKPSAEKPAKEV